METTIPINMLWGLNICKLLTKVPGTQKYLLLLLFNIFPLVYNSTWHTEVSAIIIQHFPSFSSNLHCKCYFLLYLFTLQLDYNFLILYEFFYLIISFVFWYFSFPTLFLLFNIIYLPQLEAISKVIHTTQTNWCFQETIRNFLYF